MTNIREHCSWVHENIDEATEKAIDIIRGAVHRVTHLKQLHPIKTEVKREVMIIGGGITGIQAALEMADKGYNVYLVERSPCIGGHMAQLSETFPTLDCSYCILAPRMVSVSQHPKIKIYTMAEPVSLAGVPGDYVVTLYVKPRYVEIDKCTGCNDCSDACPVEVPDEYNMGLTWRKAIYIPFPQGVPRAYALDLDNCLGLEPIACSKCIEACEPNAINYDMQPENFKIMMTSWLNYLDDDVTSLISIVKSLPSGVVYVVSLSKQLLNYSATDLAKILNSLPNYKGDTVAELNSAISSLDPLTDDYLLNNPYPLVVERSKNTIIDQTFNSFAKALEDGANISSAVDSIEHNLFTLSSNLSTVSSHLKSAIEMFPYQLTVSSAYDSPKGSGWYDPGTNVTFSIETPVGFIVKQIFTNWSGDSNATTPKATIVMDDHHTVIAEWRTDYSQLMSYTRIYILAAIFISVIIFYILLLYHYNYLK